MTLLDLESSIYSGLHIVAKGATANVFDKDSQNRVIPPWQSWTEMPAV